MQKKIATISMLIAIGVVLQYIDSLIGGKIGIANIVNIIAIPIFSPMIVFFIAISRALLGGLLGGGFMSAMYSVCGSILAVSVMLVCKPNKKLSFVGIGMLGAVAHNIGQITLACTLSGSFAPLAYLPYYLLLSAFSGGAIGYLGEWLVSKRYIWLPVQK